MCSGLTASSPSNYLFHHKKNENSFTYPRSFFVLTLSVVSRFVVSQNGPKPIQLVVPSAVMAAVSMLTMNCSTVFQVFFFMKFEI